jgi:trk system potassium uptake protein TrkH
LLRATTYAVRAVILVINVSAVVLFAERAHGRLFGIENVVFETVSAFGTVGLSIGITPMLSDVSKLALICTMFMGRVGLFVLAISYSKFSPKPYAEAPRADILL